MVSTRTSLSQQRLRLRTPGSQSRPARRRKRRFWHVIFGWFRDETFWRDVAKSIVSTGAVALIVYLYALGAGYVTSPTGSQTLRGIWNVAITAIVGILIGTAMLWGPYLLDPEKHKHRPLWVQRALKILTWVLAIFVGMAVFHTGTGFFNDIWWAWPLNTPFFHVPMSNEP